METLVNRVDVMDVLQRKAQEMGWQTLERLRQVTFGQQLYSSSWEYHIPEVVRPHWQSLSDETRLLAFYLANNLVNALSDDREC